MTATQLRGRGWTPALVRERLSGIRQYQREYRANHRLGWPNQRVYRQLNAVQFLRHKDMLATLEAAV